MNHLHNLNTRQGRLKLCVGTLRQCINYLDSIRMCQTVVFNDLPDRSPACEQECCNWRWRCGGDLPDELIRYGTGAAGHGCHQAYCRSAVPHGCLCLTDIMDTAYLYSCLHLVAVNYGFNCLSIVIDSS